MSKGEVNGKTGRQVQGMRLNYTGQEDFEQKFCLVPIEHQPEDYDGPQRYCSQYAKNYGRCHYHGGAEGSGEPDNPDRSGLDPLAPMKHGMTATRENLFKDIQDPDQAEWMREMYDWITQEWPEAYGIDVDNDPLAAYEFHALAVEIIRAERGEGFILKEGEKHQKEVVHPNGERAYEDTSHYLSEMIQRQRKLIMKMEDNLGISRKERLKQEEASDATEVMKGLTEIGKAMLDNDNHEYDASEFA